jgi:single-stranded-DNA-specific exonuclease
LEALRKTKRPGLVAMMELTELSQPYLTEEHIAFVLAPRMNALGRLGDANRMVELLTTYDLGRARILAVELEGINAQRKLLSDQVYQAAQAQLIADAKLLDYPVLVLSHPTWPAGVIGVVASRLVEQYHRPVILLSAPDGGVARGSARSIEGINITSVIAANKNLIKEFGGHPMAAGLSIDPSNIPDFRQAVSRTVSAMGLGIQKEKDLQVDGYLRLPELSLDLVEDLERLAPFGAGNPPLVFATRNLILTGYAAVGRSGEHLQLTIEDELGYKQHSIWWQGAGSVLPEQRFDLAYSVRASTYRGQRDVQIEWIDYMLAGPLTVSSASAKRRIEVIDLRGEPEPEVKLNQFLAHENITVWGEAIAKSELNWQNRLSLQPACSLAIWTIPPGPVEIQAVVDKVKPAKVYLFGIDPLMDDPTAFLNRLVGLLKHVINTSNGIASLNRLAAASAQRATAVKAGLEWLDAEGQVRLISIKGDEVELEVGDNRKKEGSTVLFSRINALLAESAAFRRYYLTAKLENIILKANES